MRLWEAIITVFRPEAHTLFTVVHKTVSGKPVEQAQWKFTNLNFFTLNDQKVCQDSTSFINFCMLT